MNIIIIVIIIIVVVILIIIAFIIISLSLSGHCCIFGFLCCQADVSQSRRGKKHYNKNLDLKYDKFWAKQMTIKSNIIFLL